MTANVDLGCLRGRTVLITGGSRGLGLYCARECAGAGANVVVAARDPGAALRRLRGAEHVSAARLDLADLGSVDRFCDAWGDRRVDVLLNCAGIMMAPQQWTADGFESHLGVNHLGHFALTGLLAGLVRDRVVTVTSPAHRFGQVHWDDLHWRRRRYSPFAAYAQSKLANLLFAAALGDYLPVGARSLAAHPGWVRTGLVDDAAGWQGRVMRAGTKAFARDVVSGAAPLLAAMTADLPDGCLVGPNGVAQFWGPPGLVSRSGLASDPQVADRLWEASALETRVDPPRRRLHLA